MSLGTGLAGSLGAVAESTFGNYVAPTRWYEIESTDLKKVKNTKQGGGLAGGRLVNAASRRQVTTLGAAGGAPLQVVNKGMGLLLAHLMGGTPTVVQQGATTAYLQTHTLADNAGKSLTLQTGVPDAGGTLHPYSFLGCKVLSAEFSSEIDGLLMSQWDFDGRDVTEAQTLAAPSYPTGVRPFNGTQLNVKVGATYGAETAVTGVTKVSCKIERPQKTDRYYAGAQGLKGEPLQNAKANITGQIEADFVTKADWADRFAADSQFSLVLEWVGPLIASTYYETFRIKLPACFLDGDGPDLSNGEDIVHGVFPFVVDSDLTNGPAIIEYQSVDTAI